MAHTDIFADMMYFRAMNWTQLHAFDPTTKDQWLKAIQKELGERTVDDLMWSPSEGIRIEPYYTEIKGRVLHKLGVYPALIHQHVQGAAMEDVRTEALECLMGGAQSIGFDAVPVDLDWDTQLKDIEWPYIQLHWRNFPLTTNAIAALSAYADRRGWDRTQLKGCWGIDAAATWQGECDMQALKFVRQQFPACRVFVIAERSFAGGQTGHQLVGLLAQVQEALHALVSAGFTIDDASAMLQINTSMSTSYFKEMIRLRVLRLLYGSIVRAYQPQYSCSIGVWIHTIAGDGAYAQADTHTNLLRATTMAMSAMLGQTSSLEIQPHDPQHQRQDTLRWARNMMHLLREESYFDQALHAAQGSYYLEDWSAQLAHDTWSRLIAMEEAGGWQGQSADWLSKAEQWERTRQEQIASGQIIHVGVNKYQAQAHA